MLKHKSDDSENEIFDQYFNPRISRPRQINAYKVHKISPDFLLTEKSLDYYAEKILEFLKDTKYLVGHNVCFDWEFLKNGFKCLDTNKIEGKTNWLERLNENKFILIDTHKMCIVALPNLKRYRVVDIAQHLEIETEKKPVVHYSVSSPKRAKVDTLKVERDSDNGGFHDAMMDVLVTKEIFSECLDILCKNEEINVTEICQDIRYTYQIGDLELIDQSIENKVSLEPEQLERLNTLAVNTISCLNFSRGVFLVDTSIKKLQDDIEFLKRRQGAVNKRGCKLREIVIDKKMMVACNQERNFSNPKELTVKKRLFPSGQPLDFEFSE